MRYVTFFLFIIMYYVYHAHYRYISITQTSLLLTVTKFPNFSGSKLIIRTTESAFQFVSWIIKTEIYLN